MFVWLTAVLPSVAAAQPTEPSPAEIQVARQLFQEAQTDGKEGRWDEACRKLHEALEIKVTPGVLFHLAVCEQNRGNYVQALNELGRAEELAEVIVATNVLDLIPERRKQIQARLAKLEIQLKGTSDDVRVTLDGSVLSPSTYSRRIPLDPGQHTLAVQNASGREQTRTFSVAAGEVKELTFEFATEPPPAAVSDPASSPPHAVGTTDQPVDSAGSQHDGKKTAGWILGGAGVAALGVGAVFGVRALSRRSDSDDLCPGGDNACSPRGVELAEEANKLAWVANIGVGLGLVGIGVGAYLVVSGSAEEGGGSASAGHGPASSSLAVEASVLPGGGQVTVGGQW